MSGLIPENIIDDILARVDIVELINGYFPLKRAGRNYKANCPFHQEKTPSFMVSSDKQIYHCFGCGESGNAFKFLMRYERMEFPEAVELLAKKAGVELPKASHADARQVSISSQLCKVNEAAAAFYRAQLNSPAGGRARAYLQKRGISDETIAECKIGLAPDSWDGLIVHLRAKGAPLSLLEKAGLIVAKESGGFYDRFRNRIIFPILDVRGRVIGFGARVLDESLPKYINSCETPLYTKGKNLYGMHCAKDAIRDSDCAVIVEGYLDQVIPFQHGLRNVVASLGTALTSDQVRLLKRYTHNAVILYDPDKAGQLASVRSLEIFIEEGMHVRVASLPQGLDPDIFVRQHGAEGLRERIAQAKNLFDFKFEVLSSLHPAKEIEGKARIVEEMLATIVKFNNAVVQSEYVKTLSDRLQVKEEALWQEMKNVKRPAASLEASSAPRKFTVNATEKLLIQLMLGEQEMIERIRASLLPSDFEDERIAHIVARMFALYEEGKSVEPKSLLHHLSDEYAMQLLCESAIPSDGTQDNKEEMLKDCISRIKGQRQKKTRQLLQEQIKQAQSRGDEGRMHALMQELSLLLKTR